MDNAYSFLGRRDYYGVELITHFDPMLRTRMAKEYLRIPI
jgi:hypothetical protein